MSQYVFNLNGKQYIGNINGTSVIGNVSDVYTKDEMIAFLADNVEITEWDVADDASVAIYFTPITDQKALNYLDSTSWNDGNMAFFQLLRHRTSRWSNSYTHDVTLPVSMLWPTDFVTDTDDLRTGSTAYITKCCEAGVFGGDGEETVVYKSVRHLDGDLVGLRRMNNVSAAGDSDNYYTEVESPQVQLTSEIARRGYIYVSWRQYLVCSGKDYKRLITRQGFTDGEYAEERGQHGLAYTVWAPELIVQGSKGSWYTNEGSGVRPERAWVYYPSDYE